MTFLSSASRFTRISLAGALALGLATLSGCGNQPFVATSPVTGAMISGRAMGGETPVTGATVTLYATAASTSITNGVYQGTAQVLETVTSGSDGGFSFNPSSYICPANQELYITASGGNAGTGANANILEVAMIGQCGSLNGFTDVNELTSIAAAYAFSSFMSVDTSGPTPVVNITAPSANASFASSNDVSAGTVTTASGLLHAYQNAINLVDPTHGVAYSVPPSNSNGIAPNALINTLGNVLQACVNSTGGTANDLSNCGKLFGLSPSLAGNFPTNTLQAALNIARNPWVSAANVTSLYNLAAPQVAFAPILSAAPKDWTVAISYPVPPNPVSGIGFPWTVALDADDNVYVTSPENDPYTPVSGGTKLTATSASACLFGWSSDGSFLPAVTPYTGTPGSGTPGTSSWLCEAGAPATTRVDTLLTNIAPDAVGDIWISNSGSYNTTTPANSNSVVVKVTTASPATPTDFTVPIVLTKGATEPPTAIAVDKWNDVFYTTFTSSSSFENIFALQAGTGGTASTGTYIQLDGLAPTSSPAPDSGQEMRNIAFDSLGNIFGADYGATSGNPASTLVLGSQTATLPITAAGTSTTAPTYGTLFNKPVVGATSGTSADTDNGPWGVATDSSNNVWITAAGTPGQTPTNGSIGLGKLTPSGGPPVTSGTAGAAITAGFTSPKGLEADGANVLWIADTTGIIPYGTNSTTYTGSGMFVETGGVNPCIPSAGSVPTANGTTCTYPDNTSTKTVAIDSTGSVWWTTPDLTNANANRLVQMIGTATATWPLLATGKPGTMPQ
jgi:hypothetical protein